MVSQGYLALLGELGALRAYWNQLLLDFPGHPAHGQEHRSIPLSLYGLLIDITVNILGFLFNM